MIADWIACMLFWLIMVNVNCWRRVCKIVYLVLKRELKYVLIVYHYISNKA
jgi:hypothetical protein